jgi:hypothetical protein
VRCGDGGPAFGTGRRGAAASGTRVLGSVYFRRGGLGGPFRGRRFGLPLSGAGSTGYVGRFCPFAPGASGAGVYWRGFGLRVRVG